MHNGILLGKICEYIYGTKGHSVDTVEIRDSRKYPDHFAQRDRISYPTKIPGYRRGIMWGEQDVVRELE